MNLTNFILTISQIRISLFYGLIVLKKLRFGAKYSIFVCNVSNLINIYNKPHKVFTDFFSLPLQTLMNTFCLGVVLLILSTANYTAAQIHLKSRSDACKCSRLEIMFALIDLISENKIK